MDQQARQVDLTSTDSVYSHSDNNRNAVGGAERSKLRK